MEHVFETAVVSLLLANLLAVVFLGSRNQGERILRDLHRLEGETREEFARNRQEMGSAFQGNREEIGEQLYRLIRGNEEQLEKIRETFERRLLALQEENGRKLEEMRSTVDEKLQSSVEKRFNESFKGISQRLDQVHQGLGEMQNLASGVGDLKKVLSNVKTRGTLGEVQLGNILEQFLAPDQYLVNAATREDTQERVEYAVKLPGGMDGRPLLLPIDSKFPVEDYQRLMDAYDRGETGPALEAILRQFEASVRKNARDILGKYIHPPTTTDFALMFVPTEGLYAEVLRRPGLFESLQRDLRITVVGPANLMAFLNSLQMGFRTLAIEKRSSEVWEVLGRVKTEFGAFGEILEKTKKKLQEAANVIDKAGTRSRAIQRKLKDVESLPMDGADAEELAPLYEVDEDDR
ncbi:DNA recombination protein RmuC [Anaerotalea alkaliphila]|nr:DNA recombination protein RmuC [Anaerotalea alkaliphila]